MLAKILNNYSTAAIQDGSAEEAIGFAEEALAQFREAGNAVPIGLVTLAEALHANAQLVRCAGVLHEFYSIQRSDSSTEQAVAQDRCSRLQR